MRSLQEQLKAKIEEANYKERIENHLHTDIPKNESSIAELEEMKNDLILNA